MKNKSQNRRDHYISTFHCLPTMAAVLVVLQVISPFSTGYSEQLGLGLATYSAGYFKDCIKRLVAKPIHFDPELLVTGYRLQCFPLVIPSNSIRVQ